MSPLSADVVKPDIGIFWEGFDIDLTAINNDVSLVYYFTQSAYESAIVYWRGNPYTPIDIIMEGFEASSGGSFARPTLTISNVAKTMLSSVIGLSDCVGAKVTRWRTFREYLDGEPKAAENSPYLQTLPVDIYIIDRKVEHNPIYIKWELASLLDFEGRKFPIEQILRDYCTHTYRRWNGSVFIDHVTNPAIVTCPYAKTFYWKSDGTVTSTASEDRCGKKLSDCRLRYRGPDWNSSVTYKVGDVVYYSSTFNSYECLIQHSNQLPTNTTYWKAKIVVLPYKGFPGVGRARDL
jgi:lambda family phage minor tail protein L